MSAPTDTPDTTVPLDRPSTMDPASDFESDEPTERCIEPVSHILAQEPVEEEHETDGSEGEETEAEVEEEERVAPETPRKRPRSPGPAPQRSPPRCARVLYQHPLHVQGMPSPVEIVDYVVKYLANAPFADLNRHRWWREGGRCERNVTFLWSNLDGLNRARLVQAALDYYDDQAQE